MDRQDSIKTLAETYQKTGFEVHAYGLMRHHFYLVVATPKANLVAGRRGFLSRQEDTAAGHAQFEQQMEARRAQETDTEALAALESSMARGLVLG